MIEHLIQNKLILWTGFNAFVVMLLALDLGVFHKGNRAISVRESLVWSGIWIIVAALFGGVVYFFFGADTALEYAAVYIIERSLSVDNIFVFILIFQFFRVAPEHQYRVLFWGIIGALVMRAVFILTGIALIEKFHWMMYVFGALLVYVGIKLATEKEKEIHPDHNILVRIFKRFLPMASDCSSGHFFVRREGRLLVTPLLLVLLVVETSDLVFAVDSIPAALAISHNAFVVYSANVFAILGLRALYFALAGCMNMFRWLQYGLALVLVFIGFKMLLTGLIVISTLVSLTVIACILGFAVMLSLLTERSRFHLPPSS